MDACSYQLRATSEMTMFYKELFRVVATDQGILHKYDNDSLIFNPAQIITGDGYPKLVGSCLQSSIRCFSLKTRCVGLCVQ